MRAVTQQEQRTLLETGSRQGQGGSRQRQQKKAPKVPKKGSCALHRSKGKVRVLKIWEYGRGSATQKRRKEWECRRGGGAIQACSVACHLAGSREPPVESTIHPALDRHPG